MKGLVAVPSDFSRLRGMSKRWGRHPAPPRLFRQQSVGLRHPMAEHLHVTAMIVNLDWFIGATSIRLKAVTFPVPPSPSRRSPPSAPCTPREPPRRRPPEGWTATGPGSGGGSKHYEDSSVKCYPVCQDVSHGDGPRFFNTQ